MISTQLNTIYWVQFTNFQIHKIVPQMASSNSLSCIASIVICGHPSRTLIGCASSGKLDITRNAMEPRDAPRVPQFYSQAEEDSRCRAVPLSLSFRWHRKLNDPQMARWGRQRRHCAPEAVYDWARRRESKLEEFIGLDGGCTHYCCRSHSLSSAMAHMCSIREHCTSVAQWATDDPFSPLCPIFRKRERERAQWLSFVCIGLAQLATIFAL